MKIVLLALFCLGLVLGEPDHSESFEEFKTKYAKTYDTPEEESQRKSIWEENVKAIQNHNLEFANGVHTFSLGENAYADLTVDEFRSVMNGLAMNSTAGRRENRLTRVRVAGLPDTVDWRDKGYVTPIKDQKQCGSCWAFSATGSLEGAHFAKTGKLVSLSEQNLVDCSQKEGNLGCFGGLMDNAFKYVKENHGIDTEDSYPYTAETGKCHYSADHVGATLKSWKDIAHGSEEELQKAVATVGPISVAIDASRQTFHLYKEGIYHDPECSSVHLDHGVLAVGYGTDTFSPGAMDVMESMDYWLVKNSWGESWGQKGYIKMARNMKNACGIATAASYPLV